MYKFLVLVLIGVATFSVNGQVIKSPNGHLSLTFELLKDGIPSYQLSFKEKSVIKQSRLGIETHNIFSFMQDFTITKTTQATVDNTWNPIIGRTKNYSQQL